MGVDQELINFAFKNKSNELRPGVNNTLFYFLRLPANECFRTTTLTFLTFKIRKKPEKQLLASIGYLSIKAN